MPTKEATIQIVDQGPISTVGAILAPDRSGFTTGQFQTIDTALRSIFPTPAEETKVQKARAILQEVVADLTDQEVEIFVTELQWLLESWLDVFEKAAFDGLTLKEVLYGA